MIDNRIVGKRIAAFRQQNGLTQQQLAAMVSVSHQAVSKWESGQALPDIQTMLELTRFFGLTVEQLICYESETEDGEKSLNDDENQEQLETDKQEKEETLMHIQQLLQMAPFMSREAVDEIAMASDEELSASQIVRLAPYLRVESLEKLIEKNAPTFNWEQLRRIAPFMRREVVDALARSIARGDGNVQPGTDSLNKAFNDIGKAFDDIGRGMGHAVKKAIRFGENVINEVSAAINDISTEPDVEPVRAERSERARALRKKAFERAAEAENWDWIAAHIQEIDSNDELRAEIAKAALAKSQREWVNQYIGEYADDDAVEAAIAAGNWKWLGENAKRLQPDQQRRIAQVAADAKNWPWLQEHYSDMDLSDCAVALIRTALQADELDCALTLANKYLSRDEAYPLALEALQAEQYNVLKELLNFVSEDDLEKILLDTAEKRNWVWIEHYLSFVNVETIEKLMEMAVDQGTFEAVDMLDAYLK